MVSEGEGGSGGISPHRISNRIAIFALLVGTNEGIVHHHTLSSSGELSTELMLKDI